MTSTRRNLLIGGGIALAAVGGGVAAFVFTRTPDGALQPWSQAGNASPADDPRIAALSYAILAPNPHNRQPWRVVLEGDDAMTLYCDLARRLPETDPYDRQIVIGFGCFLELLRLAAGEAGYGLEIAPFPQGEPEPRLDHRPVARLQLLSDGTTAPDPLFRHALARRTCREPYDTDRPVQAADLDRLIAAAHEPESLAATAEPDRLRALRDLTWRAFEKELRTPAPWRESVELMRIGKREIEANPDGLTLSGAGIEVMKALGIVTREALLDPTSAAFEEGLERFRPVLSSGMAYLWQVTPTDGRRQQLAAGADWLRLNLAATAMGLGLQPLSQALQEYPEMTALRRELEALLQVPAEGRLQMLGRLGYAPPPPPSPRWPVETILGRVPT